MTLIIFLIVGLIAGALARLIVPGKDSMGILGTLVLGCVGSFVGGMIWNFATGNGIDITAGGIIVSVLGAIVALLVFNAVTGRKKKVTS